MRRTTPAVKKYNCINFMPVFENFNGTLLARMHKFFMEFGRQCGKIKLEGDDYEHIIFLTPKANCSI